MIVITGAAGFIGAACAKAYLATGETVIGLDNLNDYYDTDLKQLRLSGLTDHPNFHFHTVDIADPQALDSALEPYDFDRILHLAAQAGVRYSIDNPTAYVQSNLVGHSNMLAVAQNRDVSHMVYASSSSVYGGTDTVPFSEDQPCDDPVSFYAATKKSNELLSNAYARIHGLTLTGLRFFTVYGPMGRPDMAYWLFADAIRNDRPITVFNGGDMMRDFTYIDDIVAGIMAAFARPPSEMGLAVPHRIYNLGNDQPESLMDFIGHIERLMGRKAVYDFQPMQAGDVKKTWADISRARTELGYDPSTSLGEGLAQFVDWFQSYT